MSRASITCPLLTFFHASSQGCRGAGALRSEIRSRSNGLLRRDDGPVIGCVAAPGHGSARIDAEIRLAVVPRFLDRRLPASLVTMAFQSCGFDMRSDHARGRRYERGTTAWSVSLCARFPEHGHLLDVLRRDREPIEDRTFRSRSRSDLTSRRRAGVPGRTTTSIRASGGRKARLMESAPAAGAESAGPGPGPDDLADRDRAGRRRAVRARRARRRSARAPPGQRDVADGSVILQHLDPPNEGAV